MKYTDKKGPQETTIYSMSWRVILVSKPPKANKKPLGYVPFKQDSPFIPSNPGKKDGGCRAGGFAKWPSYAPKDPYSRIGTTWVNIFKKSFRGNKTKSCIPFFTGPEYLKDVKNKDGKTYVPINTTCPYSQRYNSHITQIVKKGISRTVILGFSKLG